MSVDELLKQDQTMTNDGLTKSKELLTLKMKIIKNDKQTIQDVHDFYEWIWIKAERLGFIVERK